MRERKISFSVMYALSKLGKSPMIISAMTHFKIFLSSSGVMGLHTAHTGHIYWLVA